jgi:hypothetical protein
MYFWTVGVIFIFSVISVFTEITVIHADCDVNRALSAIRRIP